MKAQHVKDIPGLEIEYVPTLIFYPKQITDIADVSMILIIWGELFCSVNV